MKQFSWGGNFPGGHFSGGLFSGGQFSWGAYFRGVIFRGAVFSGAFFRVAFFPGAFFRTPVLWCHVSSPYLIICQILLLIKYICIFCLACLWRTGTFYVYINIREVIAQTNLNKTAAKSKKKTKWSRNINGYIYVNVVVSTQSCRVGQIVRWGLDQMLCSDISKIMNVFNLMEARVLLYSREKYIDFFCSIFSHTLIRGNRQLFFVFYLNMEIYGPEKLKLCNWNQKTCNFRICASFTGTKYV